MTTTWTPTSAEVYAVIWARHQAELIVYGTITRTESSSLGERQIMTEWGFKKADSAIMKIDQRGEPPDVETTYWLAMNCMEPETA